MTFLTVLVQSAQAVDASVLAGTWALRGIALLTVGSFGTGLLMLRRVDRLETLLVEPYTGVIPRLEKLDGRVDRVERRVDVALGASE